MSKVSIETVWCIRVVGAFLLQFILMQTLVTLDHGGKSGVTVRTTDESMPRNKLLFANPGTIHASKDQRDVVAKTGLIMVYR